MKLHTLTKLVTGKKKRQGLGYGTGTGGHTSGRGQKGQKSRNGVRLSFTGSSWVWFKRLPFMRGKSRFNTFSKDVTITLTALNVFKSGTSITKEFLCEKGLISKSEAGSANIKIVATGELKTKLIVSVHATLTAQRAIIAAGGEYRDGQDN